MASDTARPLKRARRQKARPPEGSHGALSVPAGLAALLGLGDGPPDGVAPASRTRTVAHMDGMWATHVYLPLAPQDVRAAAEAALAIPVAGMPANTFHPSPDPHISLSRTLFLQKCEIDPLLTQLSSSLVGFDELEVELSTVGLYVNDERATSFLALNTGDGSDHIRTLIDAVDGVLRELHHETYFKDPRPHCTVGWAAGDLEPAMRRANPKAPPHAFAALPAPARCRCTTVHVRCGNRVHRFPLRPQSASSLLPPT
jgi:hypothetical protein